MNSVSSTSMTATPFTSWLHSSGSSTSSSVASIGSSTSTTPPTTPLLPYLWKNQSPREQHEPLVFETEEDTPKIANHSKRRLSDAASTDSHMQLDRTESTGSLDCQSLQRSLKRVRLSSSPGELRLQLDLRHLVMSREWIHTAEDIWFWPRTGCRLEQCQVDPLRLIFYLPQQYATVWILIPRMYPHRPPTVTRILHGAGSPHPSIQAVKITMENPPSSGLDNCHIVADGTNQPSFLSFSKTNPCTLTNPLRHQSQVLLFSQWKCIMRLADILEFLFRSLSASHDASWETAPPMPDARGFLTPNRFDLGYQKPVSMEPGALNATPMDLKE